jgi:hypothetical protein
MEKMKKIKVKFKSPKGNMYSGYMGDGNQMKDEARSLRAENLRKENMGSKLIDAARKLRAKNLKK